MQVCHFQHLLRQTDKNEPGRFLGEGVSFRAKLIGVLEVPEARGDRMCQEALADLKMAIRAAGEHKQRIQVHVAIDGLRLRDDKTGDSLYHHPVHKISFIAQDMTDSRAFGYIFGSPDTGHRFFGIKTDKAASQVVIAMRDLFQVVFELKKKEIELAKQQLEGKSLPTSMLRHTASAPPETKSKVTLVAEGSMLKIKPVEGAAEGGVADLVDLEQELCSLRRGLTQVEGLTPSDPFGDSFIMPGSQKGLLPPPPSGSSSRGRNTPASTTRTVFSPTKTPPSVPPSLPFDLPSVAAEFDPPAPSATAPPASLVDNFTDSLVTSQAASLSIDVFTELDPLGTGRSKPYVDKKLFFQELKNPPKKVLKDLVPQSLLTDIQAESYGPTTMTSLSRHSGGSVTIAKPPLSLFASDPFADADPFDAADLFSEAAKDDPFTSMAEYPRGEGRGRLSRDVSLDKSEASGDSVRNVFNGALQVSLPPEPAPKSPRLHRQESSSVRLRPLGRGSSGSPPPPLPPKKPLKLDDEPTKLDEPPPILPPPNRKTNKREPCGALRGEGGGARGEGARGEGAGRGEGPADEYLPDEYLAVGPPPLPAPRRFDITLAQLLTCSMEDLAHRLRVPTATLSSMTLPQLTEYLRSYLAADNDRAHINVETQAEKRKPYNAIGPLMPLPEKKPPVSLTPAPSITSEFKTQFEDDFAPSGETSGAFVANFDDFDKKANPSYDRYAAFREIQEQELNTVSILLPTEDTDLKNDSDDKEELSVIDDLINSAPVEHLKDVSKSPLKSLDELTLDSFNKFRVSVSPKPTHIDAKIEDIKSVMKNLQIEQSRRSVSPRENSGSEPKSENPNDRYAALREITITEPQDEFESLPPDIPKERKRSDEKSDGFDNSDFFDCIDNSSLSFSHVEDAFRKSPSVKERVEERVEVKAVVPEVAQPVPPPARLSTGSMSDVVSGSSPETKEGACNVVTRGCRWAVLRPAASPATSDSSPRYTPSSTRLNNNRGQTSSSSRDVSPWEEEVPPRLRPPLHRDRDSRHNSSGSRDCLDSGSGREKEKKRDKRERDRKDRDLSREGRDLSREGRDLSREGRDLSREGRDSGSARERDRKDSGSARDRDRRDSGSGRDRGSKDRDHRDHRRDRRSRDRVKDTWERETDSRRGYGREKSFREGRSRERGGAEYRDKDRHRPSRQSYDEDDDYSDGCGSGRSSPRDRWPEQRWRRDERNYGSLGWRETRRRADSRQSEDGSERRYGSTLGWSSRRSSANRREPESSRDSREPREGRETRETREGRETREARRRPRREEGRRRDYRFSNDFSPRERDQPSPFDNDYHDAPAPVVKKRAPYATLEGTRFAFEPGEPATSPLSASSTRAAPSESPAPRFRFDSDSVSPRSLFEDDFTSSAPPSAPPSATPSAPRARTDSIAEEDENDLPPLRTKPQNSHRDIKKSESVNIFTRDSDPFDGDDFFACTGSERAARRENWPGDFQPFEPEHA